MIVLDTAVLMYAVGGDHPLREPSRLLIQAIRDGRIEASTTIGVIQEFAHVYSRRGSRTATVVLARRYAELLAPLAAVDDDHLDRGLRLFEGHPRLGSFDAILAAVALSADVQGLVSPDKAFSGVPRLRHVAPGTPEFERLLAG